MWFCIRFCNGKTNNIPQIFFRTCFSNDHVGHAHAITAGHAYKNKLKSLSFSSAFAFVLQQRESPKSQDFNVFALVTVRAETITELILERAGPVIFKTLLLELIAFGLNPVICPARRAMPENYWKQESIPDRAYPVMKSVILVNLFHHWISEDFWVFFFFS